MTIVCSRCGGDHMRSECPTLGITRAGRDGEGVMTLKQEERKMVFHWRNGWYWSRLPDGSVEVRNHGDFDKHDPACAPGDGRTTLIIPPNEWASIVASVSKGGETSESYSGTSPRDGDDVAMISAEAIRMAEQEASDRVEASRKSLEAVSLEIARLRAALRRIADMCPATQELTLAHQMAQEAEEALSPQA